MIVGDMMTLWVDADACPGAIKELIIRSARRLKIPAVFVANKYISIPESSFVTSRRIGVEPEAVDMYITENARAGDVAVTQDIPLASVLVPRGVTVISTRGELFTEENIGERLSIRNFMQDLREAGGITPGPKEFATKDRQRFADTLDRVLSRLLKPKAT
ncbi:MAG: YaiI/YqxD family protein [Syntrophobacteraceae bacterium]